MRPNMRYCGSAGRHTPSTCTRQLRQGAAHTSGPVRRHHPTKPVDRFRGRKTMSRAIITYMLTPAGVWSLRVPLLMQAARRATGATRVAICGCATLAARPSVFARHRQIPRASTGGPALALARRSTAADQVAVTLMRRALTPSAEIPAWRHRGAKSSRWPQRRPDLCVPLWRRALSLGRSPRATSSDSHRRGQALVATQLCRHLHQVAVVRPRRRAGLLAGAGPP